MQIAVISDLHLGAGDITDQFGHIDEEFVAFLKFLEKNFEQIILLGDIYETLMPRHYGNFKETLQSCYDAHKSVIDRFSNKQYKYIHGNHDMIAKFMFNAPDEYILVDNKVKLLFMHGHQHDKFIDKMRVMSEFGVFLGGWLLRFGFESIYRYFATVDIYNTSEKIKTAFEDLTFKTAFERDADIIVSGHTHVATRNEHNSRLYLNSGTCTHGRYSFLSINTRTGDYGINKTW